MAYFLIGFNAVMPLIIYLLIGHLLKRWQMVSTQAFNGFNRALFTILIPLSLFTNIYHSDLSSEFSPGVLGYILIFSLILFLILAVTIPLFNKDNTKRGVMLQGAIRSNTILFGLPLGMSLLGEENLGLMTMVIAIAVPLINILSVIGLEIYTDTPITFRGLLGRIFSNPMVIATLIGIFAVLLRLSIPEFIDNALVNINRMVSPLALMVMGGTFQLNRVQVKDKPLLFTVLIKLLVTPGLALLIAILLSFRGPELIVILIATAGPTSVSSYAQAVLAGGNEPLANQIVVFTTTLSMFTLVFWISLFTGLGFI